MKPRHVITLGLAAGAGILAAVSVASAQPHDTHDTPTTTLATDESGTGTTLVLRPRPTTTRPSTTTTRRPVPTVVPPYTG